MDCTHVQEAYRIAAQLPLCCLYLTNSIASVVQYKFIVDREWKYAADQPAMYDDMGNVNNVLEVQEYVAENLENLSGFEPPASPPSR